MKRNRTNQYSKPTTLTALLLVLLLLISGCADPSAMAGEDVTTAAEVSNSDPDSTKLPEEIILLNEFLSDELIIEIDNAYINQYNKSLQFDQTEQYAVWYLGTYDDGIVFYKKFIPRDTLHLSWVDELDVGDIVFSLSSYDTLCIYKNGKVTQVYDAYENGELSEEYTLLIVEQYGKLMNRFFPEANLIRPRPNRWE